MFNEGGYWERAKKGEFSVVTLEDRHPALMAANEPLCTHSQMVSYREPSTDYEVARVHQYLRPNGDIGASGKPDPKRLYKDGELYRLEKKAKADQPPTPPSSGSSTR